MDKYISQGQLGSPADTTSKVRFNNSGDMALMQQQAGIGNAVLAGAKMFVDRMQNTDITKAGNMYNDKMAELRSKLMQNKEENALDNMAKYEEGRQKILDEIYRTGPRFIREGLGRQQFESSIEKDWIGQKNQMRGYMLAESEKYSDNQTANRLFGYNQNISEGYSNPDILALNVQAGAAAVAERYKYYGPEKIKAATRQWMGQAFGNAINTAISKDDWDSAGALLQGHGNWLDSKLRASLDKVISERKRNNNILANVNSLYDSYGYDVESAWRDYSKTLTDDNSLGIAAAANKMIGRQLGNDTCAVFVGNMITEAGGDTSLNSTLADGIYVNYESRGLTFNDRSQLRDGDLVFWSVDGSGYTASNDKRAVNSDAEAYKGITHVGIYDAKTGKVIQSGTHGVSKMDIDTKGYNFVGAAHQPGKEVDETRLEEERKKFFSSYAGLINRDKQQQNLIVENTADRLLTMYKDGQYHSAKEYEDLIYGITGSNYAMYGKLLPLATHFAKGGGYHDLSFVEMYALENAIDSGNLTQDELKDILLTMNVKPGTAIEYMRKNKAAINKEQKVNWTDIKKAFKSIDSNKDVTDEQMMGVMIAAKRHVDEYAQDPRTKGQIPSVAHILNYMQDSLLSGAAGEAAGGYKDYSVATLMRHNIYRIDDAGDGICQVYFFGRNTPVKISEENLAKVIK